MHGQPKKGGEPRLEHRGDLVVGVVARNGIDVMTGTLAYKQRRCPRRQRPFLPEILDRLANLPTSTDFPDKAVASAARRERNRARLRRAHAPLLEFGLPDGPIRFDARIQLAEIRRVLPARDWQLVCCVALGMEYLVVAKRIGGTVGSLRIRMARIRLALREAAEEAALALSSIV